MMSRAANEWLGRCRRKAWHHLPRYQTFGKNVVHQLVRVEFLVVAPSPGSGRPPTLKLKPSTTPRVQQVELLQLALLPNCCWSLGIWRTSGWLWPSSCASDTWNVGLLLLRASRLPRSSSIYYHTQRSGEFLIVAPTVLWPSRRAE